MKTVGRIVVRDGKVVGLFYPTGDLPSGVYQLDEIMGELVVKYLGKSCIQARDEASGMNRFNGLDITGLWAEGCAMLTADEREQLSRAQELSQGVTDSPVKG